jgi:hypothetical protein
MLDTKELKHNNRFPSSIDIWLLLTACIISLEDVGFPTIIEIKKILQDFWFSKWNSVFNNGYTILDINGKSNKNIEII